MAMYISMLRGVNVGGKKAEMAALAKMFEDIGATSVETYIQSGNVVFETEQGKRSIGAAIEKAFAAKFGFATTAIIRIGGDLRRIVDSMPFSGVDTDRLHVTFLSEPPASFQDAEMDRARKGEEAFSTAGTEIYVYCPYGYGRTKLNNSFIERKLNVAATTRNWKTVNALLSLARG